MAETVPPHVWMQRRRVIWVALLWAMVLPLVALLAGAAEGVAITAITTAGGVVTLIVGIYAGVAAWDDKNRGARGAS
ncbi:hypothetical protein ABWI00_21995 [Algihabitans albus]|uniref:hypothetical protein n=1 Tax=Algihabitans albus TaxID=2164067 RepID=UPI0035D129A5